jgi:2-alkyl-3-oxoalkanoate reductase
MDARRVVLVTGASGFIGSRLCAALTSRGDSVRALYRRSEPPAALIEIAAQAPGRVELFRADLGDPGRVREAVAGADAVIHSAALASDWGPLSLFIEENHEATVRLLEAARGAGASTFVFISSAVVQGFGPHVDSSEAGPYYALTHPYQISKRMAEEYVLAQNSASFRTTAIRPCNVYGPGDHTSTYRMFDAIMGGVFGYIGGGSSLTCPVYIDDLCAGILSALYRRESGGEAILLTDGAKVTWKDYVAVMYGAIGSSKRPLSLPRPLAFAGAALMTAGARALRSKAAPPLTMYRVEQASRDYHFSNAKARGLLGFEPRTFYEEGLARTARAYLADREARLGREGRRG